MSYKTAYSAETISKAKALRKKGYTIKDIKTLCDFKSYEMVRYHVIPQYKDMRRKAVQKYRAKQALLDKPTQ